MSNADKRTPHTDALDFLGNVLTDHKAKRDAIHLAVEPVIAGQDLVPGDHVTLKDGAALTTGIGKGVGIVDPFILRPIKKGEKFFLVLYPRMITSLRHVWEHPAFLSEKALKIGAPADVDKAPHVKLIAEFADSIGAGYDEVMDNASYYNSHGEYWIEGGRFEGQGIPNGFWDAYFAITGETKNEARFKWDTNPGFFSCSC